MADELIVVRNGPVVTISLNRPDKLNAFNAPLRSALREALEIESSSDSRAILLRGNGASFCAGQDLADVNDDEDLGALLDRDYAPIIRLIRSIPKPVVCAVGGVAAGAGANLALSCDIVLAAESARFIQAFIRIGLLPDVGGTWVLPRLIGMARARAIAMLGTPIDGQQAAAWGMIYRAVPAETLEAEAESLAATLAALPTQAIGLMKRAFDAAEGHSLDEQLRLESALQTELGHSADFAEGKRAFLGKRAPKFTGKVS